jgi:lipopolysaccharide biosynthesis protein
MPLATRDRLRQRFLDRHADLVPVGPRGQLSATQPAGRHRVRADGRALSYVEYRQAPLPDVLPATLVAFYLPQFHTIAENDAWWGKGFTEWRNVSRALPQFEGQVQPRLPGELGFYDLSQPQVMHQQAWLAREYGIGAFCFYFYWFAGKTLLETPLRHWLADPTIDLPFCLCWANEKWSRTWDGRGNEILIDQAHSADDDLAFIAYVADYLRDPRYLRVDGKPMLLVYRPGLLPDCAATATRWRNWCRDNGIGEIHLAYVQSFERPDPATLGFDAAVEFPPNLSTPPTITAQQYLLHAAYAGEVLDWTALARDSQARTRPNYRLYPGVNPGWDNEARRSGRGRVYLGATPLRFGDWLRHHVRGQTGETPSSRLVFINAWNEWAEGAVMEPDARHGHAFLEAARQALQPPASAATQASPPCVIVHAWHLQELRTVLAALQASGAAWRVIVTTSADKADDVEAQLRATGLRFELVFCDNHGRDILPFLRVAHRLLLEGVDVVLKLHTKRSSHRDDGDRWLAELLERLLSGARVTKVQAAFTEDAALGLVGPEGHRLAVAEYLGGNANWLCDLRQRLQANWPAAAETHDDAFFSGSMFWLRLRALAPLFDAGLSESDFEAENGQIDGTLAHAIERSFGTCARVAGFTQLTVAEVLGQPESDARDYPFAQRC